MADTKESQATNAPAGTQIIGPALSAVLENCHISDARHAGDYTLCVYLLKMREYFRWEMNLPYQATLPREELSEWITQREEHWETLAEKPFCPVPVAGKTYDAFDSEAINAALNPEGYVYSSGYGRNLKPVFFLGALDNKQQHQDYTLLASGHEFARELAAPPAMSMGKTIFIRRESLRRMIWEKIEEWRWNKPENAMQHAIGCYDFDSRPEQSLDAMTDNEVRSVMLHEAGEVEAGQLLGSDWEKLLVAIPHSKAELMVRAVRDNLADALSTFPALLRDNQPASLHFYMANMSNMRKQLFPSLVSAYSQWQDSGDTRDLQQLTESASRHWLSLANTILELFRSHGDNCQEKLVATIESNKL